MPGRPLRHAENIADLFFKSAALHARGSALRCRHGGAFSRMTYEEAATQVREFAAGMTLLGLRRGDRVGLVSESWDRWLIADLAVLACGAVDVPRSASMSPEELAATLRHSGCRMALAAGPVEMELLHTLRQQIPELELLVDLSDGHHPRWPSHGFTAVREAGRRALQEGRIAHEFPVRGLGHGDLATIVYTSGTTGRPKGVMLSHGNILSNVAAVKQVIRIGAGESLLSILPSWHMYERTVEYTALDCGAEIVYTSLRGLQKDLRQVRPTFFVSVPRLWAKIHQNATRRLSEASRWRRAVALAAWSAGTKAVLARRVLAGEPDPGQGPRRPGRFRAALQWLALAPVLHLVCRGVVFRPVRKAIGGRLRGAISGGASLPLDLDLFFAVVGIRLLNGYGMTETSPVLAVRTFDHNLLGTVGRPLDGTEVRVVGREGEELGDGRVGRLHVRGPQVMLGYYRDPETTRAVLAEDGWLDTGDLGCRLPTGDLVLAGRVKDTIVLANGENVEPEPIEERINSSRYVEQVMVVGQDQDYLAALVVPAFAELEAWARERSIPFSTPEELVESAEVRALMKEQLRRRAGTGDGGRQAEVVKRFQILPRELSVEDGTLTPTGKVRRVAVAERYRAEIQGLFQRGSTAG
jgi:long-chain acyl-CoA synthetase